MGLSVDEHTCIRECSIGCSACQSSDILHSEDDNWLEEIKNIYFGGFIYSRWSVIYLHSLCVSFMGTNDIGIVKKENA